MKRTCLFYKEEPNYWSIDLPEWEGDRAELQMVAGADTLLDILAGGFKDVRVIFSDEHFDGADKLNLRADVECPSGAVYELNSLNGKEVPFLGIWLCDVTRFVFGGFPPKIYFKRA